MYTTLSNCIKIKIIYLTFSVSIFQTFLVVRSLHATPILMENLTHQLNSSTRWLRDKASNARLPTSTRVIEGQKRQYRRTCMVSLIFFKKFICSYLTESLISPIHCFKNCSCHHSTKFLHKSFAFAVLIKALICRIPQHCRRIQYKKCVGLDMKLS